MDNAIDALKMAFAVFVFVMALTISMRAFSQAKTVSDEVFYMADKTNFYEYTSDDEEEIKKIADGRIVSLETMIPTLYRYYKENFNVIIKTKKYGDVVFNLEQEIKDYNTDYKLAPWLGNANIDTKLRVDTEIEGGTKIIPEVGGIPYKAQIPEGLLEYAKGTDENNDGILETKKFKETFREYRYSGQEITVDENGEIIYVETKVEKPDGTTEYIRNLIPDQETLELVKGNTKIEIIYEEI